MNSVACDSQALICVFWVDNFEHKMEFELGAKERLVSGKEAVGDEWVDVDSFAGEGAEEAEDVFTLHFDGEDLDHVAFFLGEAWASGGVGDHPAANGNGSVALQFLPVRVVWLAGVLNEELQSDGFSAVDGSRRDDGSGSRQWWGREGGGGVDHGSGGNFVVGWRGTRRVGVLGRKFVGGAWRRGGGSVPRLFGRGFAGLVGCNGLILGGFGQPASGAFGLGLGGLFVEIRLVGGRLGGFGGWLLRLLFFTRRGFLGEG